MGEFRLKFLKIIFGSKNFFFRFSFFASILSFSFSFLVCFFSVLLGNEKGYLAVKRFLSLFILRCTIFFFLSSLCFHFALTDPAVAGKNKASVIDN